MKFFYIVVQLIRFFADLICHFVNSCVLMIVKVWVLFADSTINGRPSFLKCLAFLSYTKQLKSFSMLGANIIEILVSI